MGKLVAIETFERFLLLLNDNQILDTSLIFILDTGLFYTHGILFNSVSYGAINNDTVTLNVGGTSKTLSLASHTHSNYYAKNADLDIDDYKIVSGSAPLLYYEDDVVKVGSTSTPTYLHGTLKAIRGDNTYTILDTGNTYIENKTISGVSMSNVATFRYGNSNFQLDYVKRENTIIALDTLASYTNMGTTNENSKFYGFMTMYTDGRAIDPKFAQIRINIDDNILEFRSSSNRNWTGLLLGGAYKNITINGTTYSLVTKSNSLPTLYIPTSLGNGGQYLSVADDGGSLVWRTVTIPEIVTNSKTQNGVVLKGQGNPNKVWMTDADGAPNWRDLNVNSILSAATTTVLGGVKVQSINTNAITPNTNAESSGRYYGVRLDANELAYVNVPWQDTWIAWKGATDSANGTAGYMPAPTSALRNKFLRGDGSWVSLNNYSLPTASNTTLGGVKTGAAITDVTGYTAVAIKDGVIYYKDTNTTYSFSNLLFLQTSGTNLMTYNSQAVRTVLAGSNITFTHSNNVLTIAAKDTTYSTVSKTAAGLCPTLPNETTTTKYLRLDGSWVKPPDNNTWKAANASQEGYVPKSTANKILRSNGDGALYWGDDANTTYTFYNLQFQNSGGTTVDTYKPTTSPAKTLKAGSNVTISAASNVITIASTDTNTWRGIQNNLTSNSTTDSLSAALGKALANGSARDNTKLPLAGGTMVGTVSASNDAYGGGGFNNGYANIILRGNTTTGTSGIVFSSSKGDTSINRPSDCAFIQFLPYGVAAATAVGTNPTINTSGESGKFVIGIHNDSGDQLWLQTSAVNDLKHVVGANVYTIYDSGNLPAYPTKSSWNYDDRYVSSLTTSGNSLRWVKNGSNNDITIPYATNAGNADTVDSKHATYFWNYKIPSKSSGSWDVNEVLGDTIAAWAYGFSDSTSVIHGPVGDKVSDARAYYTLGGVYCPLQLSWYYTNSASLYARTYYNGSWYSWKKVAFIEDLTWSNVSSKPATATRWPAWSEVTGKPSTFAPSSHTHDYLPLSGGTLAAKNAWLNPARLQLLRPDGSNYSDRSCIGTTDGNLHLDCYSGNHAIYLNYYNGKPVYFCGGSYYINGSYYNGTAAAANSVAWSNVSSKPAAAGNATTPVYWTGSGFTKCTAYGSASVNYATSAGNADTVDSQHFKWSNDSNSPTYLWAANSSGTAFLCARGSMSVNYANSAGNADTVDSQHFSYSNADNNPTYLWGTNSNGTSILAHRGSMSVNYANSAGSVAWGNISSKPFNWSGLGGQPTWLWGSNDGSNYYVWNPSNFSVNYASSAGYASSCGSFSGAWAIEGGNEVNLIPSSFGSSRLWFNYTAKGGSHVNLDSNYFGNAHTGTVNCYAASFGNSSDIRYKQIIEYVDLSLEQVAYAPIFKFMWTNKYDPELHAGSSALYWLGVVRELVHYDDYIDLYFLNYGETALISAVTVAKETLNLKNIVLLLQSENEQLKSRISMLESTVRLLTES